MKLLFCDNTIWGLVNFRGAVFKHFYEQGAEIVLVAPTDAHTEMKTQVPDYVRFVPVRLNRTSKNPLEDLAYMARLWRIYRQERPDCIFHYTIKPNIYGSLAAKLAGLRSIAMVAGLGYAFSGASLTDRIAQALYRFGLRYAERIFVLNESNKELLIERHIVKKEKVVLLHGGEGIDTNVLQEGRPVKEGTPVTFLMVARALYDKGYAEFIEAARQLKEQGLKADCCLLGPIDESYPNAVSRQTIEADAAQGLVRYLGFSTHPLDTMRKEGIVIVLPSYHEGMSRSLMEACALGKPIITSDIPGCREMVEDGKNGYLVPAKDGKALAEAMSRYLSLDWQSQAQMGHESRRIALERYDIRHVIAAYERVLYNKE